MPRAFAIGDIHGCSKTLKRLLLEKIQIRQEDHIYCVGDYVDRGPDSKGVVDFILQLREQGYLIHTLRGNHEQLMMDSVRSTERLQQWTANGGSITLESFGVSSFNDLSFKYRSFFRKTEFYKEAGKYIVVHAGLNFNHPDPFNDTASMMWIRNMQVDPQKLGDRIIIHGHTPIPLDVVLNQSGRQVLDIDAGCVYTHRQGFGHLVAYNMSEGTWIAVENCEEENEVAE